MLKKIQDNIRNKNYIKLKTFALKFNLVIIFFLFLLVCFNTCKYNYEFKNDLFLSSIPEKIDSVILMKKNKNNFIEKEIIDNQIIFQLCEMIKNPIEDYPFLDEKKNYITIYLVFIINNNHIYLELKKDVKTQVVYFFITGKSVHLNFKTYDNKNSFEKILNYK